MLTTTGVFPNMTPLGGAAPSMDIAIASAPYTYVCICINI